MRSLAAALALLASTLAPEASAQRFQRPAPPSGPSVVEHSFGGDAPAFRLELRRIPGDVHRLGGPEPRRADFADYSRAGTLRVERTVAVGPLPTGPALVPPGEYAVSLSVAGPEGLPVLSLASPEGLRLRLPLVAAPRPERAPTALEAVSLAAGGEAVSIPVALHLPTVSGLLLIGEAGALEESPMERHRQRRRSRGDVIREEMQRRALESGHVRPMERRQERERP